MKQISDGKGKTVYVVFLNICPEAAVERDGRSNAESDS